MAKKHITPRLSGAILLVSLLVAVSYFAFAGTQNQVRGDNPNSKLPPEQVPEAPMPQLPASAAPVMMADFSVDDVPDDWETIDWSDYPDYQGKWGIAAEKLAQEGTLVGSEKTPTMLVAPGEIGSEGLISVQVFPQGNHMIGLVSDLSDAGYYSFRVFQDGSDPQQIRRILEYNDQNDTNNSYVIAEDKGGAGFRMGEWQELRIERDGERILCFFDGELVFDVTDQSLAGGKSGIYTLAMGDLLFDNYFMAQPVQP